MNEIAGELHGVKWSISLDAVEQLASANIIAVAEIKQAIETYHNTISQQTENT